MQETKENIAWAMSKLLCLKGLPGFPQEADSLRMIARAFLRIVHNKTYEQILREKKTDYDDMVRRCRESDEDSGGKTPIMDRDVNDAEWLLDRIADSCERFPMPVRMRAIHATAFDPACEELKKFPVSLEDLS